MFGKPKSSKRPASARRRAEADEEDDPEVRALMAQIHEMAAQVYENQKLIEQLEAHPKFAGCPKVPELPRVRVPEDVDGDALPDGDADGEDFNPGSELMVLDGDELKPITAVDEKAREEYGEALVRLEPSDKEFLRELAQGAGKENNRLLEEDRPRPVTQGRRLRGADDERKPVRRGDRRRSGDVATAPRNPSRSAASRRREEEAEAPRRTRTGRREARSAGAAATRTRRRPRRAAPGAAATRTRHRGASPSAATRTRRRRAGPSAGRARRRSPRDSPATRATTRRPAPRAAPRTTTTTTTSLAPDRDSTPAGPTRGRRPRRPRGAQGPGLASSSLCGLSARGGTFLVAVVELERGGRERAPSSRTYRRLEPPTRTRPTCRRARRSEPLCVPGGIYKSLISSGAPGPVLQVGRRGNFGVLRTCASTPSCSARPVRLISLATRQRTATTPGAWRLASCRDTGEASFLAGCPGTSMELDRLAEASPMPRRRVAFADLSNSAERAATRKKPVARTAAPSPSIPLPSPSSAASKEYPPWTRCFDPRYKYHYWYNHTTGVSTWTEPDEAWVDEQRHRRRVGRGRRLLGELVRRRRRRGHPPGGGRQDGGSGTLGEAPQRGPRPHRPECRRACCGLFGAGGRSTAGSRSATGRRCASC